METVFTKKKINKTGHDGYYFSSNTKVIIVFYL